MLWMAFKENRKCFSTGGKEKAGGGVCVCVCPWKDVVSEWKIVYYHYYAIYVQIWCNLEHQVITVS
jgi:hypothetical protein